MLLKLYPKLYSMSSVCCQKTQKIDIFLLDLIQYAGIE